MEEVRVGIVGTGSIGMVHLATYQRLPGYAVTAVCDIDKVALDRAHEKSGAKAFADYHDLVERRDVDLVAVCVPNYLHAAVAIGGLEAGKHIFVEKPIGMSADEARAMIAARDRSGKLLQVGVCQRFRGDSQVLKAHILAGELGHVYFGKCGYLRRSGIPGMGGWFTTAAQSGGGPIVDLGVHALDLTMWLMGNFRPASVSSCGYAEFGPRGLGGGDWGQSVPGGTFDVEDLAAALITFEDGATVFLEVSWAAHVGAGRFYSTLMGDKGGIDLDPPTIYTDEFGRPVDKRLSAPEVDAYAAEHRHFLQCIAAGTPPMPNAEEALAVQAVLDGIRASAKAKGASVPVVLGSTVAR